MLRASAVFGCEKKDPFTDFLKGPIRNLDKSWVSKWFE